ncbi:MAG: hypothetical protein U0168_15010 [Nannocystaceae bacterium]
MPLPRAHRSPSLRCHLAARGPARLRRWRRRRRRGRGRRRRRRRRQGHRVGLGLGVRQRLGLDRSASGSGSDSGTGGTSDGSGTTGADCDCDAGASVPVCGVDGMDYDAACGIECVPVVISCMQACPCPPVQCGIPCDPEDRVCTTTIGGVKNAPPSFSCDPVPPSCDGMTPTCDCVATGCDCTEAPPGYFQVTCNAP